MQRICVAFALGVLGPVFGVSPVDAQRYAKLSPFEAVRWEEWTPHVQVQGEWYELLAIGGVPAKDLVQHCRKAYPGREQKRFEEDLVQALSEMGYPPGEKLDLSLRSAAGKAVALSDVPMTPENRERLRRARAQPARPPLPPPVRRSHSKKVADEFRSLITRPNEGSKRASRAIEADLARHELDQLEAVLEDRFSYLERAGVDYRAGLDAIRASLGDSIRLDDFALQLGKLMARFGDGHSRVRGLAGLRDPGYLPFEVAAAEGRWVAYRGRELLDADHPFLESLDGVPIETWLQAAKALVPAGAPHFVEEFVPRELMFLAHYRRELRLPGSPQLEVGLVDAAGESRKTLTLQVSGRPEGGRRESFGFRRLDDDLGYIRIPSMDDRAAAGLPLALSELRETRGLIIDVRGNGGGSRDALQALFPYLMAPDSPPHVANIAAYRLSPAFPKDHLGARTMYRANDDHFSKDDRRAVKKAAKRFRPEWKPANKKFSPWHYFVLRRQGSGAFHYDRPVIVLQDAGCFSATDIFLGALSGWPGVTLMGGPSGGGSGRSTSVELPRTGLRLRLSSMASFRPDGRLYEARGVDPDVAVERRATDVIGTTDTSLDAARARLLEKSNHPK